jgi:hypothetical protein
MAYSVSSLSRISSSANGTAPIHWSYYSATDSLATIVTSAYFNDAIVDLTNGVGKFKISDVLHIEGSDDRGKYYVTAVTTNVTVAAY